MKRENRLGRNARTLLIVFVAAGLHAYLILTLAVRTEAPEDREDVTIFRMVDVEEYVPPPPEPEPEPEPEREPEPEPPEPEELQEAPEEEIAEEVIETEQELEEEEAAAPEAPATPTNTRPDPPEIEYLAQHMISAAPRIPLDRVRDNIEYPTLANRQGIEGVVYLELYIDAEGSIREIKVLRDPGYGLGEAAIEAFEGIQAVPAEANGSPVAVKFRFPVRFQLK